MITKQYCYQIPVAIIHTHYLWVKVTFVAACTIVYFNRPTIGSFSTVKLKCYIPGFFFNAEQTSMQTNYLIGMLYDLLSSAS